MLLSYEYYLLLKEHYRSASIVAPPEPNSLTEQTVEDYVEKAKRAFALRKYEQAVEHYASALEVM